MMTNNLSLLKNLTNINFLSAFIVALIVLSVSCYGDSTVQAIPKTLDTQIDTLISKTTPDAFTGIMLTDAETGRLLYQKNAHQYFLPASIIKLFTAAAALYRLKPDYKYATAIYVDKDTPLQTLFKGNFYIKFSGDPSLTRENLEVMIKEISVLGIKKITGNIVLDQTIFPVMPYPQGINLDDIQWGFGAPVTSVIINRNSVPITINPDKTLDKPVKVAIAGKDANHFVVKSSVKTVTASQANEQCAFNVTMSDTNKTEVNGCWPINFNEYKRIAIKNPVLFATQIIRDTLKKENIELNGNIVTGTTPDKQKIIIGHLSKPINLLIRHMLHFSDNMYANAILKTLGYLDYRKGDFFSGIQSLKRILSKHTDINFQLTRLFDGAGLSNYNKITPYQINQLLYAAYHSKQIKTDFLNAMATPGANGTLQQRMHAIGLKDNLFAKTGSMKGVQTLAGYLKVSDGKTVIFSLMTNNCIDHNDTVKKVEDQLLSIIQSVSY
ncbi:MAG: D-alanyl-D-alanine carboxypeptidase/D-alanyl-D-alanine-endopeptidase [Endozoicomonadaceae bacterium]|nr:D-alanyl-D-alanine carboxypeptidase/D-alanyl-D-alanine-endopeptidase [Endozoicomonadaceae bacterium]